MKSKQIFFYALKSDWNYIINQLESNFDIKYVNAGLKDLKKTCYKSFQKENDNLGKVKFGDWNHNKLFLILPNETELEVRIVPQQKGGVKYAIDQMKNKDSIMFSLGGVYKGNTIIASKIGTISKSDFSNKIFKFISKEIKKTFKKVDDFYVGEAAFNEFEKNIRFTTDINIPLEYDLKYQIK